MIRAVLAALLAVAAAAAQASPFAVRDVAVAGGRAQTVVAADVRAIACLDALRGLSAACGWNIVVESTPLENDLRFATVELDLAGQDPRLLAQLIAVAGGADVVFDEAAPASGDRSMLHVVRPPSMATDSGRQRLRSLAGQWYRSFLRDELRHEPLVEQESVAVRMHLGQLLVDNGDLESAIAFYTAVYDQRPHDHVGDAMLKVGECHFDLAQGARDRARQKADYQKAEEWARRLMERLPTSPLCTPATILLGRAMLGQAMLEPNRDLVARAAEKCQEELRARVIKLLDSVQMLDVWLLAGEAQFLMAQPAKVQETMLTLRESPWFGDMGERQFRDYHFLLGYGALGTGKAELAMRSLEWFQVHADADPRRGMGWTLLAEAYLSLQRFVQARAAAVEARNRHLPDMTPEWRERTLRVTARTALALGEKESAFLELEQMVLRGEERELALFLVDEMIADRQWQRAIAVARPMVSLENAIGDRARFKTVQAWFEQAAAGKHFEDFPAQATKLAQKIQDPELRSRTATMIGEAYTELGKLEHAADAYRGILR